VKSFNSIGSALQPAILPPPKCAGHLSASIQNITDCGQSTFGSNSQANTDYQSFASAVQSGNFSARKRPSPIFKLISKRQPQKPSPPSRFRRHDRHPDKTPTTTTSATDNDGDSDGSSLNASA